MHRPVKSEFQAVNSRVEHGKHNVAVSARKFLKRRMAGLINIHKGITT